MAAPHRRGEQLTLISGGIMDGAVADGMARRAARLEAARLLDEVGLESRAASRYSHEFSGGQRQRIEAEVAPV